MPEWVHALITGVLVIVALAIEALQQDTMGGEKWQKERSSSSARTLSI